MGALGTDIRYAARMLLKIPAFTAVAVFTLGLGIGANTTIFSCVNALLLRPFPYLDPDRIVALRDESREHSAVEVSYANFADWQAQNRSFSAAAAHNGNSFNLAGGDEPERVEGEEISASLFPLLGIAPVLGRNFLPEEDRVGGAQVVILSHALWEQRFASDSGIIGRSVLLNGEPRTVVGVMPRRFQFPADAKLWTPLALDPTKDRGSHYLEAIARLKPGVTLEQANSDLATIAKRLAEQHPETNTGRGASVATLRDHEIGEYRPVLYIMMGAVGFVLLIACANVANLLLARATARAREIAVRSALGAGRGRIIRQLLTESLIVALLGAGAGLLLAAWGLDFIDAAVPSDRPFWMVFSIDGRVLLFTLVVAVVTAVVFGLAPAWQISSSRLNDALKEGGQGAGTSLHRNRLRSALVVVEIALSLILLVGAALMISSFVQLQRVDPGFNRRNALSLRFYLAGTAYDSTYERLAFLEQALTRISSLPDVRAVAAVNMLPLGGGNVTSSIEIEGQSRAPGEHLAVQWIVTSGEYFRALEVPLLKGRDFTPREKADTGAAVAVISEVMAQRFWPAAEPLGKRFRFSGADENAWLTVVGVAANVKHRRLNTAPESQFYLPYSREPWHHMSLVVRTRGEPVAAGGPVRQALRSVDPNLPMFGVGSLDEVYRRSAWESRFYGQMFGAFALIALVLAAGGVYGVMAYMVSQRTREIGVRMALGAHAGDVLGLVLRRGLVLAAIGIALGAAGGLGVTRVLASLLYGVGASDGLTFAGVSLLLGGIAVVASYFPARRAAGVDPMVALRSE